MPLSWETFALTPLQQRKGIHHFFMHEVNDFTFNSCWKMNFTPQLQQLQVGADVMRVVNRCDPHLLYLSELRFFHKQSIKSPVCLHGAFIYLLSYLTSFLPIISASLILLIIHLRPLQHFAPICFTTIALHSQLRVKNTLIRE